MNVSKCQALISHVNARKENGEDGGVMASDISVEFSVPREAVDNLFPVIDERRFTDQFYSGDDTRLDVLYPIVFGRKVEDLRIALHIGRSPMVFAPARIREGMRFTPQVGQYVKVQAKLQVHPNKQQSGELHAAVNEYVDLEIAPMTEDHVRAAA